MKFVFKIFSKLPGMNLDWINPVKKFQWKKIANESLDFFSKSFADWKKWTGKIGGEIRGDIPKKIPKGTCKGFWENHSFSMFI